MDYWINEKTKLERGKENKECRGVCPRREGCSEISKNVIPGSRHATGRPAQDVRMLWIVTITTVRTLASLRAMDSAPPA